MPYCFWRSSVKFQGQFLPKLGVSRLKNRQFESSLSKITRPVAAIKSLRFALFGSEWLLWWRQWWQSWHHQYFRFSVQGGPLSSELFCRVVMAHNYRMLMSLTSACKKCQLFAPLLTIVFTTSLACDIAAWRRKLLLAPHNFCALVKNTVWLHYNTVSFLPKYSY